MRQFSVRGMSCAACSARVEKAVSKLSGVTDCSVSLLTNSMGVEGTATDKEIIAAVENAGYGASKKKAGVASAEAVADVADALVDHETPKLLKRFIASLVFLLPLMYVAMGYTMWGWPLPSFFGDNPIAVGLLEMILSATVMIINKRFFTSGFKALWNRSPNMDTLVGLGSATSFAWSLCELFAMTACVPRGDGAGALKYLHNLYFESAAMILTLITIGKMLEARSKGKTTDALKRLMRLAPKTAVLIRDGVETEVPISEVKKGDVFVVRPGENVPVDGVVLEGSAAVNEAALTGEFIPADKQEGDYVSAATVNQSGYLRCRATRVGEDTTLSQIIKLVSDAAATKAPVAKIADRVSGVFVPTVIIAGVITFIVWLLLGREVGYALARGISVLVISCPCALGLATPVAIMVGNGLGAKNGILFKTAVSLEEAGRVDVVVLDKTGTITSGEPRVTDVIPVGKRTETELMEIAYSLEAKSEHPLARAVVARAEEQGIKAGAVTDFKALAGNGLTAVKSGAELYGGNLKLMRSVAKVPAALEEKASRLAEKGKTPLFFSENGEPVGVIAVADTIKEDSPRAVKELQNMGVRVVMLTGDNERTARAVGEKAGVDEVVAGVLPDGKEAVIRELQKRGKVAMVGDGINDAPALTRADIGIAIGAGADVAIDAADVVLMQSRLSDVPAAIRLSRATLRNIHENLFWAFFYNSIGIPIAAGVFIPLGLTLNPMIGAAAMSLSSFCVVTNALRLNLFKLHDARHDRKMRQKRLKKEKCVMEKTMKIEGMMCEHCEARVKKALEAVKGVASAEASHEEGRAVVTLKKNVSDGALTKAVEKEGYKVLSVE